MPWLVSCLDTCVLANAYVSEKTSWLHHRYFDAFPNSQMLLGLLLLDARVIIAKWSITLVCIIGLYILSHERPCSQTHSILCKILNYSTLSCRGSLLMPHSHRDASSDVNWIRNDLGRRPTKNLETRHVRDTIRYDTFTCTQKLTHSQLNLPQGTNKQKE